MRERTLIEKAEKDSNNLWKIRWEKFKYNIRAYFDPFWCDEHKMPYQEHGFEGMRHCPECRREWYNSSR